MANARPTHAPPSWRASQPAENQAVRRRSASSRRRSAITPRQPHLLQIGQCQAATGKLVDASETYETLSHMPVANDASEAFRQAQKEGRDEAHALEASRSDAAGPDDSVANLPLGPHREDERRHGTERAPGRASSGESGNVQKSIVSASGYREASQRVDIGEGASQSIMLTLTKSPRREESRTSVPGRGHLHRLIGAVVFLHRRHGLGHALYA